MSLRVGPFWFTCKECYAGIVLLDYEMKCPKCGRQIPVFPKEKTLFTDNAISTMMFYKKDHGSYQPLGFFIENIGYELLSFTYAFFDLLEKEQPEDKKLFLDKYINNIEIDNDERDGYLKKHYRDGIAGVLTIYENPGFKEYLEDKYGPMPKEDNFLLSFLKKVRRWFSNLIS
jgi:hypothetical protein